MLLIGRAAGEIFFRGHFAGKPVVASRKVSCFLRLSCAELKHLHFGRLRYKCLEKQPQFVHGNSEILREISWVSALFWVCFLSFGWVDVRNVFFFIIIILFNNIYSIKDVRNVEMVSYCR